MMRIKPLSQTSDTVTLRRSDFRALLGAAEDILDLAAAVRHRSYENAVGWSVASRRYLTREEADRLLGRASFRSGHTVALLRVKRGSPECLGNLDRFVAVLLAMTDFNGCYCGRAAKARSNSRSSCGWTPRSASTTCFAQSKYC